MAASVGLKKKEETTRQKTILIFAFFHFIQRRLKSDSLQKSFFLILFGCYFTVEEHWRQEFLVLYANGVLAFFNEPYGTCSGLVSTRSNILDVTRGQSIPVPLHKLPLLPEWASPEQLVLARAHKVNFYLLFQTTEEAKLVKFSYV